MKHKKLQRKSQDDDDSLSKDKDGHDSEDEDKLEDSRDADSTADDTELRAHATGRTFPGDDRDDEEIDVVSDNDAETTSSGTRLSRDTH